MNSKLNALQVQPQAPLSEAQLKEIESRVGHELPSSYRHILGTYGGMSFDSVFYPDLISRDAVRFGWLFDYSELIGALEDYSDSIPDTLIPIGEDSGGNIYALGVSGRDYNKLYFHDHSIGWQSDAEAYLERGEPIPPDLPYQTVELIGESFEAFIESLFLEEEEGEE
jgi:hypothetical protein